MAYNRVKVVDLLNNDAESGKVGRTTSSHTGVYDLPCGMAKCTRRFKNRQQLEAHHARSHSSTAEYVCPHCQSNFSTAPNLNKHVRTSLCFFAFFLRTLKPVAWHKWCCAFQIRSVHEKLKPFKCDQCSSMFSFRDALLRHTRMVHDQVRPFPCPFCVQKFKAKAHLSKHCMAIHSLPLPSSTSLSASNSNQEWSISARYLYVREITDRINSITQIFC